MAIEPRRGCGYRKVGGLYLCGSYIPIDCDRLPMPLHTCPVCGQGIKVSRGFTEINPLGLWGIHDQCADDFHPCFVCDPQDETAYIMGVGEKYYKSPQDFIREGAGLGFSKRIPFIPKRLEVGKTIIYLAHPKAVEVKTPVAVRQAIDVLEESETRQPRLLDAETVERATGIFSAFIPQRIEMLVWQRQSTPEALEALERRGITPVIVPDGETDHA